jgi:hypothetical protein
MSNQFWGNVAQDLVKTVEITKTRTSGSVDFYSEFAAKHDDGAVPANYQHVFEFLQKLNGVLEVTETIQDNTEIMRIKFDSMLIAWPEIKKSWEESYLGLLITISAYNQDNGIITEISIS